MKKVRFESCDKLHGTAKMNESECHFPRPFIEKQVDIRNTAVYNDFTRLLPFSMDPVQRFESSNSSPYPLLNKTNLNDEGSNTKWSPSYDLELSMLDASNYEPRKPTFSKGFMHEAAVETEALKILNRQKINPPDNFNCNTLTSIENIRDLSSQKDNRFFLTRGNLHNVHEDMNLPLKHVSRPTSDKENNPLLRKLEIMKMGIQDQTMSKDSPKYHSVEVTNDCSCHHCQKSDKGVSETIPEQLNEVVRPCHTNNGCTIKYQCRCRISPICCDHYNQNVKNNHDFCQCSNSPPQNLVDKKTWAIEKYERYKNADCKDVQKQTNAKEKREPTVTDLFKIIKLQNEQLQLLQDKVDKFISVSNSKPPNIPIQSYTTNVDLEPVNSEHHKISIGVMTSFEMVRTSTVINKEVVKCTNENAQIQCNRSQISIKEFVAKQPVNLNFLDGIAPVGKNMQAVSDNNNSVHKPNTLGNVGDEKTLNELSLYNVHVDNATTPLMSPEQTLYLDVRDYSDSEMSSDHSNVGWTYYNKVMTHVNGMLQDSDMPSSASALYRNTRQQCVQMQIDKTNVSVTKRVKFGDDPLGIHQPHIYAPTTDTSLKMNQLAAKYLKNGSVPSVPQPPAPAVKPSLPFDMSFATRNYMERHKLIQGVPATPTSPPAGDIPRFLDITALKRQTKLL